MPKKGTEAWAAGCTTGPKAQVFPCKVLASARAPGRGRVRHPGSVTLVEVEHVGLHYTSASRTAVSTAVSGAVARHSTHADSSRSSPAGRNSTSSPRSASAAHA